jgi:hypothetical protein
MHGYLPSVERVAGVADGTAKAPDPNFYAT